MKIIRTLAVGTLLLGTGFSWSVGQAFRAGDETTIIAEAAETAEKDPKNPLRALRAPRSNFVFRQAEATQSAAIRTGGTLFRERCADCHGADAKGDRGPALTGLWTSEAADNRAFQIIRSGVPGSIMPPSQATDEEIRAVVAYLRSISTTVGGSGSRGNAANGEKTFWDSCGGCHYVNGRGSRLGPDLSRIASSQSREALTRSIREATASIASGYDAVTLVTRNGQRIQGVRKGEDSFSIQIMDTHERLQGYLKAELGAVSRDTRSLMPSFAADRLSDRDLDDLLDFLGTLRSNATPERGRP